MTGNNEDQSARAKANWNKVKGKTLDELNGEKAKPTLASAAKGAKLQKQQMEQMFDQLSGKYPLIANSQKEFIKLYQSLSTQDKVTRVSDLRTWAIKVNDYLTPDEQSGKSIAADLAHKMASGYLEAAALARADGKTGKELDSLANGYAGMVSASTQDAASKITAKDYLKQIADTRRIHGSSLDNAIKATYTQATEVHTAKISKSTLAGKLATPISKQFGKGYKDAVNRASTAAQEAGKAVAGLGGALLAGGLVTGASALASTAVVGLEVGAAIGAGVIGGSLAIGTGAIGVGLGAVGASLYYSPDLVKGVVKGLGGGTRIYCRRFG